MCSMLGLILSPAELHSNFGSRQGGSSVGCIGQIAAFRLRPPLDLRVGRKALRVWDQAGAAMQRAGQHCVGWPYGADDGRSPGFLNQQLALGNLLNQHDVFVQLRVVAQFDCLSSLSDSRANGRGLT